ncbi:hypothetical protein MHYP_G00285800 [Metynnis hypsauchen]
MQRERLRVTNVETGEFLAERRFALRRIPLLSCKMAQTTTPECHHSFSAREAKYRSETRLFRRQQPGSRTRTARRREESMRVIMRTHVACVKIKPYSSLAASTPCLSPSQDMAPVQPS